MRYGWDTQKKIDAGLTANLRLGWDRPRYLLEPETVAYFLLPGATGDVAATDLIIKQIKYGSGVVYASVTAKLSTNFITQPSIDLRLFKGFYATLNDGTKTLKVLVGDAGTGETLSAALNVSNIVNGSADAAYTTFDGASPAGFHAVSNGSATHIAGTADEILWTKNALYKVAFSATLTSGTAPRFFGASVLGATSPYLAVTTVVNGANVKYANGFVGTTTGVLEFYNQSTATEYTIADLAIQLVTAPSALGAWFSNPVDGGINYNAASYTLTITRI